LLPLRQAAHQERGTGVKHIDHSSPTLYKLNIFLKKYGAVSRRIFVLIMQLNIRKKLTVDTLNKPHEK